MSKEYSFTSQLALTFLPVYLKLRLCIHSLFPSIVVLDQSILSCLQYLSTIYAVRLMVYDQHPAYLRQQRVGTGYSPDLDL